MTKLNAAIERTDAKLRYADVLLFEMAAKRLIDPAQGTDWARAHQEGFLFHLLGVRDALLQELNLFHGCGLAIDQVRKADLAAKLEKQDSTSPALDLLNTLESDQTSWLSIASRMRHHSMHRRNVPRQFFVGGASHDLEFLMDPLAGDPIETDYMELFKQWRDEMRQLVQDMRAKMPGDENG